MENVFSNFALPAMRTLTGFKNEGGTFYLPRAVSVPKTLQRKVFPEIGRW